MKNLFILLFTMVLLSSCKKEDPPLFTIPVTNLKFEVDPAMSPFNSFDIPINNVNFNSLNLLDGQGIDTADIKAIVPYSARLYLPFADNDLDFLKEVAIRLCFPGDNGSFCGQEAFWYDESEEQRKDADHLLFGSNVNDLREYVLTENINIQVVLDEMWRPPGGTFNIFLDLEFEVR